MCVCVLHHKINLLNDDGYVKVEHELEQLKLLLFTLIHHHVVIPIMNLQKQSTCLKVNMI